MWAVIIVPVAGAEVAVGLVLWGGASAGGVGGGDGFLLDLCPLGLARLAPFFSCLLPFAIVPRQLRATSVQ